MLNIAEQLQAAFKGLAKALTVLAQQQLQQKLGKSSLVDSAEVQLQGVDALDLRMADYAMYVEKGRRPGKQPPVSVILAWLRRKRITSRKGLTLNQLAYLIARSIARKGIKRRPFLADLANDLAAYAADYAATVASDITDDVLAQLK